MPPMSRKAVASQVAMEPTSDVPALQGDARTRSWLEGAAACLRRVQQECCAAVRRRQGETNVGMLVRPRLARLVIAAVAPSPFRVVMTAAVAVACVIGGGDAAAAPLAYITSTGANAVVVVDVATGKAVRTIPVGTSPFGVAVGSDGT